MARRRHSPPFVNNFAPGKLAGTDAESGAGTGQGRRYAHRPGKTFATLCFALGTEHEAPPVKLTIRILTRRGVYRFRQRLHSRAELRVHGFGTSKRNFLREVMFG